MQAPSQTFKTFLSHRYKSPEVNLYFFEIFTEAAQVQFEVAVGNIPTNVTRLERAIRSASAFVGIYPLPIELYGTDPTSEQLTEACQYFKLEMALAYKFSKPCIFFIDKVYRNTLWVPDQRNVHYFDAREIYSPGKSVSRPKYLHAFKEFCKVVKARDVFDVRDQFSNSEKDRIVFIPPLKTNRDAYNSAVIDILKNAVTSKLNLDFEKVDAPSVADSRFVEAILKADFVITDINDTGGALPYLEGKKIPLLRLKHVPGGDCEGPNDALLYNGFRVGYPKDIIKWATMDELQAEFLKRLTTIKARSELITTQAEAIKYFRSAALRKERIFVSYSQKDKDVAASMIVELKKRFASVFDYRDKDNQSIPPGTHWMDTIFDNVSKSSLGIILLSADYVISGNCTHEALALVQHKDENKLKLLPVKLYEDAFLKIPEYLSSTHYWRYWEYNDPVRIVAEVERQLDSE